LPKPKASAAPWQLIAEFVGDERHEMRALFIDCCASSSMGEARREYGTKDGITFQMT
jgi:hypothetical protein